MIRRPPRSTLFPYTTLFRFGKLLAADGDLRALHLEPVGVAGKKFAPDLFLAAAGEVDRKSTRLNSSHSQISYAVFRLKKKKSNLNISEIAYQHLTYDPFSYT